MGALNRPLSGGATVGILVLAGFGVWGEYRHAKAVVDPSPPARTRAPVQAVAHPAQPPGPVFPGFDPTATLQRLQGVWLYDDEILEIRGATMTRYGGEEVEHRTLQVSSPCSLSMTGDGHSTSRAFSLSAAGVRFDAADGVPLGASTLICSKASIYIVTGDHCTGWDHVGDGSWEPRDEPCSFSENGFGGYALVTSEFDRDLREKDGVFFDFSAGDVASHFATVDDAGRAVDQARAAVRAKLAAATSVSDVQLVLMVLKHRSVAVGAHVRLRATIVDVDRGSGLVRLKDSARLPPPFADAVRKDPPIRCKGSRGIAPHPARNVLVEGTIVDVSDPTAMSLTVDLADCVLKPAN